MKRPAKSPADRIPNSMPLYKEMARKYPDRNPLLSAVHDYHKTEEIDGIIKEYVGSLKSGPNKSIYEVSRRGKNHPGSPEAVAERHFGYQLSTFKLEMEGKPGTEETLSQWEESIEKLLKRGPKPSS